MNAATQSFEELLLLVGKLNYSWTNTESLLIHLIAGLAPVDKETAIVIFLTLNTTRARLDLVERLSKLERTPDHCRQKILRVTTELAKTLRLRNKYNHCIYSFGKEAGDTKTLLMRISDRKNEIKFGKTERVDKTEMEKIERSIDEVGGINEKIWKIIFEYKFPA